MADEQEVAFLRVANYTRFDGYDGTRDMRSALIPTDIRQTELFLSLNDRDEFRVINLYLLAVQFKNRIPYYDNGKFLKKETGVSQRLCKILAEFGEISVFFDTRKPSKNKNKAPTAHDVNMRGEVSTSSSKTITSSLNSIGASGSDDKKVSEKEGFEVPVEPTSAYLKSIRMKPKWSKEEWGMAAEFVGEFFMRCRQNPEWEQQNGFDDFAKMISRETLSKKQLRGALEKAFKENIAIIPARWHLPSKTELEAQHESK